MKTEKRRAGSRAGKRPVRSKTEPQRPARGSRREKALSTRRRMLESAYRLFCARGWASTTMSAIADEAGVAVQTLYFTFRTKGALLGEVLGAAILGFDRWHGPTPEPIGGTRAGAVHTWHQWFAAFEQEPDARRALRMFVEISADAIQRSAPLNATMLAAAGDPEVDQVRAVGERRRAETFGLIVELIARKRGGLRRGLSTARATDVLLVIFSPSTWQGLSERGWSRAECGAWFVETLTAQLLPS